MIENSAFVQSELTYRTNRIRTGIGGSRRRHVRGPWVRRPADAREKSS